MKTRIFAYLILLCSGFVSCNDNDGPSNGNGSDGPFKKTLLLYMVAENSLSNDGYSNITKILRGSNSDNLKNNNVLIYFDPRDKSPLDPVYPVLIQLTLDKNNEVKSDTIRQFNEQLNSASAKVLGDILDIMQSYESDIYDLILWGHATNWIPADYKSKFTLSSSSAALPTDNNLPTTYAYGDDNGDWLELQELANALPDNLFDLILFDACYMGSVEVAYEFRNKANHFIASAAEIIQYGFPYDRVMDYLLSEGDRYSLICQEFYDYYQAYSGDAQSATISWTKLDRMDELASLIREIISTNQGDLSMAKLSDIQNYDRQTGYRIMRDLDNYIEVIASNEEYATFQKVFKEVVPFERHTERMLSGPPRGFLIDRHCGLSIYPYYSYNAYAISRDYEELEWFKAVYK